MNWCKIGLHDWEVVQDTGLIWEEIFSFLRDQGFSLIKDKDGFDRWRRDDGVQLYEWLPFHGGLVRAIPSSAESRACLRCGKTHKNYNLAPILKKVLRMVQEEEAEKARRQKAMDLLERSK